MTDTDFRQLCNTFGFAPSRALREMLDAAARQAVLAEREACAEVCETAIWSKNVEWWMEVTKTEVSAEAGRQCAAAIRARKEKT